MEEGAFFDGEISGAGPIDLGSDQVCRQKVRGKLNALEFGPDGCSQCLDRTGFGQSWNTFDKNMSFGEQPHQQPVNQVALPHKDLVDFISDAVDQVMLFFDSVF